MERFMAKLTTRQIYFLSGIAVSVVIAIFLLSTFFLLGNKLRPNEKPPQPQVTTYNVIFQNIDGTELSVKTYAEGTALVVPPPPTFPEDDQYVYSFVGWDQDLQPIVMKDMVYTAVYETTVKYYDVTFYGYNNVVLYSDRVPYGSSVNYNGATPLRPADQQYSYLFEGWDVTTDRIVKDTEAHAVFSSTLRRYTIRFLNENGSLYQQIFATYGSDVSNEVEPPHKPDQGYVSYVFDRWDADLTNVQGDMEVHPIFTALDTCKINFVDNDGTIISTKDYEFRSVVDLPEMPLTKDGLYFAGWNQEVTLALGNKTYVAVYSQTPVTFTLRIEYVFSDGKTAGEPYLEKYSCGDTYFITSPTISDFTPNLPIISGKIYGNLSFTVTYTASGEIPLVNGVYEISTREHLVLLSKRPDLWSKNFKLMQDVSLEGVEWTGIGTIVNPFTGSFDGNKHLIYDVTCTSTEVVSGQATAGFFNAVSGRILNLNVQITLKISITNTLIIGGLVGDLTGQVENCMVLVNYDVTANYIQLGTLVGRVRLNGSLVQVEGSSSGTVVGISSTIRAGGIAGYASNATIQNCFVTGELSVTANGTKLDGDATMIGDMKNINEITMKADNTCKVKFI